MDTGAIAFVDAIRNARAREIYMGLKTYKPVSIGAHVKLPPAATNTMHAITRYMQSWLYYSVELHV